MKTMHVEAVPQSFAPALSPTQTHSTDVSVTGLPDAATQRLHMLCWRPGALMHDSWWDGLDLNVWRGLYRDMPRLRTALDALIVKRRAFPAAACMAPPDALGQRLLALEKRLGMLCTALGLIVLDCDEHLLLGDYRRLLHSVLGANGCDKVLLLKVGQGQGNGARMALEQVVQRALQSGFKQLDNELRDCPAWHALACTLPFWANAPSPEPHGERIPSTIPAAMSATSMLFRLARFL